MSDVSYDVLRSDADDTIYLSDVLKKRYSVKPKEDPCGLVWELYNEKNLGLAYFEITGTAREHKHLNTEEMYYVKRGEGNLVVDDKVLCIKKGDSIQIPKNAFHYLKKLRGKSLEVLVITHPRYDPNDFIPKT